MRVFKTVVSWGWSPALITALAIVGFIYEWPTAVIAPILGIILIIGLVLAIIGAREKNLELSLLRLRQLAGYFSRRFMGSSSLSIFPIINGLFKVNNPQLWEWARACEMSQRIFNAWSECFMSMIESDVRLGRLDFYLRTCLYELWLMNNHYCEFVDQFYEIADKMEVSRETISQYNRFAVEYNAFAQDFRENVSQLRKISRTEIEPPSIKFAKELPETK